MSGQKCQCMHHSLVPLYVVLIGALFLLEQFTVFTHEFVSMAWPILVILAGLTKMCSRSCKCCSKMH
jgi:hypothetical protein